MPIWSSFSWLLFVLYFNCKGFVHSGKVRSLLLLSFLFDFLKLCQEKLSLLSQDSADDSSGSNLSSGEIPVGLH